MRLPGKKLSASQVNIGGDVILRRQFLGKWRRGCRSKNTFK